MRRARALLLRGGMTAPLGCAVCRLDLSEPDSREGALANCCARCAALLGLRDGDHVVLEAEEPCPPRPMGRDA